ncbi:hypothetical protein WJX73_008002 [Symbiochloris irregularis]|uniref:Carotenoid oxygenase n=1 Tax=Symbiochloris irregularis TaxID=706552 RepID=A0AAW1NU17_9CHLO
MLSSKQQLLSGTAPLQKAPAAQSYSRTVRVAAQAAAREVSTSAAVMDRPTVQSSAEQSQLPTQAAKDAAFRTDIAPEQERPFELEVSGSVPKWLKGSYIRNGPGHYAPEMKHMFDGYGLLSRFIFEDGKVSAMARYTASNAFKLWKSSGKMQFSEFGTSISTLKNIWNTLLGVTGFGQGFTDNATVNTLPLPSGELLAMTETIKGQYRVRVDDLHTIERAPFVGDSVPGDLTSAHPAVCPDGSVYNLAVDFGRSRTIYRLDPETLKRTKLADVPTKDYLRPSWVHDLPATENYIVVVDAPLKYDIVALSLGRPAISGGFSWSPEQGTQVHLINRHTGATQSFECPVTDFYCFHFMNAFESADGKTVFLDCPVFKHGGATDYFLLDNLKGQQDIPASPVQRMTIPLDGSSKQATLSLIQRDTTQYNELGRINPLYKGHDYQYAYHLASVRPTPLGNALGKLDVRSGETQLWHEPGCIPQEPLFIPRPGAKAEDDGVVVSAVAGADGRTFILVLDGQSWKEVARAHMPYGMAFQFHGQWYPS